MKSLQKLLKESLRLSINDQPEIDFSMIDKLYEITIVSSMLMIDVYNIIDASKILVSDNTVKFNGYKEVTKSNVTDKFLSGSYNIGKGFLYEEFTSSNETTIWILLFPENKNNFNELLSNINKFNDEISVKDLCDYINLPDVTDFIKQHYPMEKVLEVKSHDSVIAKAKQELNM